VGQLEQSNAPEVRKSLGPPKTLAGVFAVKPSQSLSSRREPQVGEPGFYGGEPLTEAEKQSLKVTQVEKDKGYQCAYGGRRVAERVRKANLSGWPDIVCEKCGATVTAVYGIRGQYYSHSPHFIPGKEPAGERTTVVSGDRDLSTVGYDPDDPAPF